MSSTGNIDETDRETTVLDPRRDKTNMLVEKDVPHTTVQITDCTFVIHRQKQNVHELGLIHIKVYNS